MAAGRTHPPAVAWAPGSECLGPRFSTMVSDRKMDARRTLTKPMATGQAPVPGLRGRGAAGRQGGGGRAGVPGGLLHLGPPAVVRVADEQQDLAPEQHEGRVCGDHGAHLRVQALQAVEAAVRAVGREEPGGGCCDSPEHS